MKKLLYAIMLGAFLSGIFLAGSQTRSFARPRKDKKIGVKDKKVKHKVIKGKVVKEHRDKKKGK